MITQKIAANAAYPVVVDPKITFGLWNSAYGPGAYINLTGAEIKAIGAAIIAAGGAGAIVTCTVAKFRPILKTFVNLVCGAVGVTALPALINYIASTIGSSSFAANTCYQTIIGGAAKPFVRTDRPTQLLIGPGQE